MACQSGVFHDIASTINDSNSVLDFSDLASHWDSRDDVLAVRDMLTATEQRRSDIVHATSARTRRIDFGFDRPVQPLAISRVWLFCCRCVTQISIYNDIKQTSHWCVVCCVLCVVCCVLCVVCVCVCVLCVCACVYMNASHHHFEQWSVKIDLLLGPMWK
jgi:hypothetical protein